MRLKPGMVPKAVARPHERAALDGKRVSLAVAHGNVIGRLGIASFVVVRDAALVIVLDLRRDVILLGLLPQKRGRLVPQTRSLVDILNGRKQILVVQQSLEHRLLLGRFDPLVDGRHSIIESIHTLVK